MSSILFVTTNPPPMLIEEMKAASAAKVWKRNNDIQILKTSIE